MAPRLGHRKSRAGCRLCKRRKVKCDEQRPQCSWCADRNLQCIYDQPPVPEYAMLDSEPSPSGPASSSTPASSSSAPNSIDHALDRRVSMFLLHRFTSVVAPTFPTEQLAAGPRMYSEEMVRIAFSHDFVMNAILAVSAQHLHLEETGDVQHASAVPPTLREVDFAQIHSLNLDLAIAGQRDALQTMVPEKALAAFYASILICISTIRPVWHPEEVQDYTPPISWLTMSRAVATVSFQALPELPREATIKAMTAADGVDYFAKTEDFFNPANALNFKGLLEFADESSVESREDIKACEESLALIGSIHTAMLGNEPPAHACRRLMAFAPIVPAPFVSLVGQGKPRALAILAQFMALTKYAEQEGYWWFRGVAERDVKGLRGILPSRWQWATDWPMTVVQQGWEPHAWAIGTPLQCPSSVTITGSGR